MKKIFLLFLLFCFSLPAMAEKLNLFENKSIRTDKFYINNRKKEISFWVENYNISPDLVPEIKLIIGEDKKLKTLTSQSLLSINCKKQKSKVLAFYLYDDNTRSLLFSDLKPSDWEIIAPDTYIDAYFRLFCIIDFKENPILNKKRTLKN
jgi:hypothetical protein